MTDIYEGSAICISALSAEDYNTGFVDLANAHASIGILRRPDKKSEFANIFVSRDNSVERGDAHELIGDQCLSTRGWAFQERLVSVASLHYTNQGMVWECADAEIIETKHWKVQRPSATLKNQWAELRPGGPRGPRRDSIYAIEPTATSHKHLLSWYDFVHEYTAKILTKDTDTLLAIAGVARAFQQETSMKFLAGLWDQDLLSGLAWHRGPKTASLRLASQYRAPSWSWASVDGQIRYGLRFVSYVNRDLDLQIHDCRAEERHKGRFGQIFRASFRATGLLQSIRLKWTPAGVRLPYRYTIVDGTMVGIEVECIFDRPREWPGGVCDCLCLWLGVFSKAGRHSVVWLLVSPTGTCESEYRRIGIGNTITRWRPIADDVFVAGKRTQLTLV